jgi:hypothetical protein
VARGYALRASNVFTGPALSTSFEVFLGPPARLAFTVQPSDTDIDRVISPAVRVAVQDSAGNTVPTETRAISVGLTGAPDGGVLSGTLVQNAVDGEATFPDLNVNALGTGYALVASASALPDSSSAAFSTRPTAISGGRIAHHVTGAGIVDRPEDLSGAAIGAYVPGGDAGFVYYPGQGSNNGTFRVPSVPPGEVYLRYNQTYVVTSSRDVDLGYHVQGRPDVQRLPEPGGSTPNTRVSVNLTNLNPLGTLDVLELYSSNAGTWNDNIFRYNVSPTAPAPGSTEVALTVDYGRFFDTRVIDAARGDQVDFVQLVAKELSGFPGSGMYYNSAQRKLTSSALTVIPFGNSRVAGAMPVVFENRTFTVDWKVASATPGSFGSYRTQVNPSAGVDYSGIFVSAAPADRGNYDAFPSAVKFINNNVASQIDVATTFTFGDPYPAEYTRVASAVGSFIVLYQLAGTTSPVAASGSVRVSDRQASFPTSPLVPQISPVLNPTINGLNAFTNRSGVGTTPTIAWSPPAVGTPTHYQVSFRELFISGTSTRQGPVLGSISTRGTQVQVPPGMLVLGKSYHMIIKASRMPGIDVQTQPNEQSWPAYEAEALSGIISP